MDMITEDTDDEMFRIETSALQLVAQAIAKIGGSAKIESARGTGATYMRVRFPKGKGVVVAASAGEVRPDRRREITFYIAHFSDLSDDWAMNANQFDRVEMVSVASAVARQAMAKSAGAELESGSAELLKKIELDQIGFAPVGKSLRMDRSYKASLGGTRELSLILRPLATNMVAMEIRNKKGSLLSNLVGAKQVRLDGAVDHRQLLRSFASLCVSTAERKHEEGLKLALANSARRMLGMDEIEKVATSDRKFVTVIDPTRNVFRFSGEGGEHQGPSARALSDAKSGLVNLGFKPAEADSAIRNAMGEIGRHSTPEQIVGAALRSLGKRD
jgi:hypothetical protein